MLHHTWNLTTRFTYNYLLFKVLRAMQLSIGESIRTEELGHVCMLLSERRHVACRLARTALALRKTCLTQYSASDEWNQTEAFTVARGRFWRPTRHLDV